MIEFIKNKKSIKVLLILLILYFCIQDAFAVPPPDFIIQAVSQIATFFTISFAFLSSVFFVGRHVFLAYFREHKILVLCIIISIITAISFIIAYISDGYYQKKVNQENLQEWSNSIQSQKLNPKNIAPVMNQASGASGVSSEVGLQGMTGVVEKSNGENSGAEQSFSGKLTLESFGSEKSTSESSNTEQSTPENSIVEIPISEKTSSENPLSSPIPLIRGGKEFVTNAEFKQVMSPPSENYMILDARENLEYDIGHILGSTHIRFADLKNGKWKNLPQNKKIYVVCWSGMRGKEVTLFLRDHGVEALYLEKGADGWVKFGGSWWGEISFSKAYGDKNYKTVFSTIQTKKNIENGAFLIDVRSVDKYTSHHIEGSINIPFIDTPSEDIESQFSHVPGGKNIITVCDEYINCFYAKIVGIELEKKGASFLGIYNKPWEFK